MKNLKFVFWTLIFTALFSPVFSSAQDNPKLPIPAEMRLFVAIENHLKKVSAQDFMNISESELYQYDLESLDRLSEEFKSRARQATDFAQRLMESGNTAYDSISSKISIQKAEAKLNENAVIRLLEIIEVKREIAPLISFEGLTELGTRQLNSLNEKILIALEISFETIVKEAQLSEERMRNFYPKHSFYLDRLKDIEHDFQLIKDAALKLKNK